MKTVEQSATLLWITKDPEIQIERAGRICYKSEDKITDKSAGSFVRKLRKSGHHAMLEHASASFVITTDRGITHEIVRHRIASYAQESTRWCDYTKPGGDSYGELSFIRPAGFLVGSPEYRVWEDMCLNAEAGYRHLRALGTKPQMARSILPTCLKADIVMAANLREWRHFISLRAAKDAHPQIQEIALLILDVLMLHAPNVFEDLNTKFNGE